MSNPRGEYRDFCRSGSPLPDKSGATDASAARALQQQERVSGTEYVTYKSERAHAAVTSHLDQHREVSDTGSLTYQTPHRVVVTSWSKPIALPPRHHITTAPGRRAFTLVEMLAVVAIIAILASVLLGALFVATEHAREERTRSLISKLHNQMMQRWEEYETRRMPLRITPGTAPDDIAQAQFVFHCEIMRMELPDTYVDLNLQHYLNPADTDFATKLADLQAAGVDGFDYTALPVGAARPDPHTPTTESEYLPAITRAIQQRVVLAANTLLNTPPDKRTVQLSNETFGWAVAALAAQNGSAEMLYLVMTTASGDEDSGGMHFSQKDVGDTDGDGMPEFIDAWGNPIEWFRWPAGYANVNTVDGSSVTWGLVTDLISGDPNDDPDPFNPRRIEWPGIGGPTPIRNFRLVPLIMSAGPDGAWLNKFSEDKGFGVVFRSIAGTNDSYPYASWMDAGSQVRRAMPSKVNTATGLYDPINGEWTHLDNITNHLTEAE